MHSSECIIHLSLSLSAAPASRTVGPGLRFLQGSVVPDDAPTDVRSDTGIVTVYPMMRRSSTCRPSHQHHERAEAKALADLEDEIRIRGNNTSCSLASVACIHGQPKVSFPTARLPNVSTVIRGDDELCFLSCRKTSSTLDFAERFCSYQRSSS